MKKYFCDTKHSIVYYGNYFGSNEIIFLVGICCKYYWHRRGTPWWNLAYSQQLFFSRSNDRHTIKEIHYVSFGIIWRVRSSYVLSSKHQGWKDLLNIKVQSTFRILPINSLKASIMKDCIYVLWFIILYMFFYSLVDIFLLKRKRSALGYIKP